MGTKTSWRRALLTGLVSSTWSTLAVQLGARLVGRDPAVDWMGVGSVIRRGRAFRESPPAASVAAGIAVHQLADLGWATLLLGPILGRVPARHRRTVLLGGLVPWAAGTAAAEYWGLLPWLQPLLRTKVPYRTAFAVHALSAAAYPLWLAGGDETDRRIAQGTAVALGTAVGALAVVDRLERGGHALRLPLPADRREEDRRFLRLMTAHHELGLRIARIGALRCGSRRLRDLSRLMAAEHLAELTLMRDWWRGWFGEEVPRPARAERERIPGMPPRGDVESMLVLPPAEVDARYVRVMSEHHAGAIEMAERVIARGGDPRVRGLARALVHTQSREIARLHRALEAGRARRPRRPKGPPPEGTVDRRVREG